MLLVQDNSRCHDLPKQTIPGWATTSNAIATRKGILNLDTQPHPPRHAGLRWVGLGWTVGIGKTSRYCPLFIGQPVSEV